MKDIQFSLTLPEKVSMNKVKGMFWRTWHALAELFHGELLEIKGKVKVKDYPVVITYDYHWTKNPLDSLNSALISKLIEDGMVHAGVLEDDSPKFVRESRLRTQKSDKYKHDTVVITISYLFEIEK